VLPQQILARGRTQRSPIHPPIGSFELPNPIRERVFATSSGKARFTVHPLPQPALEPDQFLMMTIRSHDQYNTTVYGLEDREDECREAG